MTESPGGERRERTSKIRVGHGHRCQSPRKRAEVGWIELGTRILQKLANKARNRSAWRSSPSRRTPKAFVLLSVHSVPSVQIRVPIVTPGAARKPVAPRQPQPLELPKRRRGRSERRPGRHHPKRLVLLTWRAEFLSRRGTHSRLVRRFPPNLRPRFSPTRFGAIDTTRAARRHTSGQAPSVSSIWAAIRSTLGSTAWSRTV